jgi:hypothetical protein
MRLIKIARGKEQVVATGDRKVLNDKLIQLRKSTRNGISGRGGKKYPVEYRIVE